MSTSTVEVLREAREFMSDEANCAPKGKFDAGERYCLMAVFTRRRTASWDVRGQGYEAVVRCLPEGHSSSVIGFYDAPGTSHADVLAVLDRAIEVEEAKAQEFTAEPIDASPQPVAA